MEPIKMDNKINIEANLLLKIITRELPNLLNTKTITCEWIEHNFTKDELATFDVTVHDTYIMFKCYDKLYMAEKTKGIAMFIGNLYTKEKEFTTLYDSFGTPIYEGDTVEYFDSCYANEGVYQEGEFEVEINRLPNGFIERAKLNGYTQEHKYHNSFCGDCIQMMKPCVGVVKWNSEFVTYEPIINSQDDYNNNSFHYVVNHNRLSGAYCKVIK